MKKPKQPDLSAIADMIASDEMKAVKPADLERVRALAREAWRMKSRVAELERELAATNAAKAEIERRSLPDVFDAVGLDNLGVAAGEGLPGFDAVLKPYYHANISSEWPEERQKAAFDYLDRTGNGDLIKTLVTVEFAREDREGALKLQKLLQEQGYSFTSRLAVPWNTLTAWLKEQVEGGETLSLEDLKLIGGEVGRIVRLKERKEDK